MPTTTDTATLVTELKAEFRSLAWCAQVLTGRDRQDAIEALREVRTRIDALQGW